MLNDGKSITSYLNKLFCSSIASVEIVMFFIHSYVSWYEKVTFSDFASNKHNIKKVELRIIGHVLFLSCLPSLVVNFIHVFRLSKNPIFLKMLEHVFSHLYNYRIVKNSSDEKRKDDSEDGKGKKKESVPQQEVVLHAMLPLCEGLQYMPDYPAFTDLSQMLFVNANLPTALQNKWRFLFSSQIHGESFSTLLGRNNVEHVFHILMLLLSDFRAYHRSRTDCRNS